ncbi:hypothetical protein CKAH01_19155 [Colletotrichum kahawae]|uniref:Uncharacterized protein n=1 Tax=Colletotrichum kahawae TaxID=34407 RepID=A0AAE0CXZ3_COLKA|nr:hypothetical protein CKAH01_19155 [Colletotrichum kahawae]
MGSNPGCPRPSSNPSATQGIC